MGIYIIAIAFIFLFSMYFLYLKFVQPFIVQQPSVINNYVGVSINALREDELLSIINDENCSFKVKKQAFKRLILFDSRKYKYLSEIYLDETKKAGD